MGDELAEPCWLPLTDDELRGVLGRRDPGGLGRQPVVTWRSPRPMSAAALVRHGDATVFVKRHHVSVRTPAQLVAEHAFAGHLRMRGQPVPAVLRLADGNGVQSVLRRGDFCYEAHQVADGVDLYRDAVSWSPYASLGHAYAAGSALARLHLAAADFGLAARPLLAALSSQWAHGDWHPSNLTWTSAAPDARVAGIFDFGLANRTFAVHDLASRSSAPW